MIDALQDAVQAVGSVALPRSITDVGVLTYIVVQLGKTALQARERHKWKKNGGADRRADQVAVIAALEGIQKNTAQLRAMAGKVEDLHAWHDLADPRSKRILRLVLQLRDRICGA